MSSSVSGVSGSNSNSIYGNRNILSGLATGLDTESMIENAVSSYNTKITSLQQRQTKLTWKQEAYRNITDPMVQFIRKYTSYTSSTNLYSAGFFNSAVITTASGANASKVSASGKTSSNVEILEVQRLAAKASYSTALGGVPVGTGQSAASVSADSVDLSGSMDLSMVSGTLTLSYGANRRVDLSFDDLETYQDINDLADAINTKLKAQTLTNSDGDTVAASKMIKATVNGNSIEFTDNQSAGNQVTIASATGDFKSTLGIAGDGTESEITVASGTELTKAGNLGKYLSGKPLSITIDGITKTITLPKYEEFSSDTEEMASAFTSKLSSTISNAFGSNITVSNLAADQGQNALQLKINGQAGSTVSIASGAISKALGFSSTTSYVDTGKTLADLGISLSNNESGDALVINGVTIGTYKSSTALETILSDINANKEAGVSVAFSKTTNNFLFTSNTTGEASTITFGTKEDGTAATSDLAYKLFGQSDAKGEDAKLSMSVNGVSYEDITRSSNNFNVDGLSITLKGKFDETPGDPVTFSTTADADKIVNAVNSMVDDLNAIMKSVHDAYSTRPLTKTNGSVYDPLTDDDQENMSDSAIEKYEEKAKTGLLFGDSDLSSLYSKLLSSLRSSGTAGSALRSMGITTSYSNGLTVLSVDEDALRDTLATNPDAVRDAFTGTGGLMTSIKTTMDAYAATSGATKGILIQKAGSTYSSLSLLDNDLQDQIDDIDNQVNKWQDKLSDKIDYYTALFTKLEELTSQLNSQSSLLSGMLGN